MHDREDCLCRVSIFTSKEHTDEAGENNFRSGKSNSKKKKNPQNQERKNHGVIEYHNTGNNLSKTNVTRNGKNGEGNLREYASGNKRISTKEIQTYREKAKDKKLISAGNDKNMEYIRGANNCRTNGEDKAEDKKYNKIVWHDSYNHEYNIIHECKNNKYGEDSNSANSSTSSSYDIKEFDDTAKIKHMTKSCVSR